MKFFDKLERKIGKAAIPRLPLIMTGIFIAGYIFVFFLGDFYSYLLLDPVMIVEQHQYWRLITWVFTIPFHLSDTLSYLLVPIALYFYYYVGSSLEQIWGKFRLNCYIFGNILLTDIAVILTYVISNNRLANAAYQLLGEGNSCVLPVFDTTRYMLLSMFLAMAVIFKDQTVLYAFVIPLKLKWLAVIDCVFMLYEFIKFPYLYTRVVIIVCVVTFLINWLINKNRTGRSFAQYRRSRQFKKAYAAGQRKNRESTRFGRGSDDRKNDDQNASGQSFDEPPYGRTEQRQGAKIISLRPAGNKAIHKCAVCGRTELDDPDLEFRYCSKCAGNREYCSDHLYTHVHVEDE